MSLLTKNGKLLTADGDAINQKGMTPLEVENLINKKIIDLGTFANNGTIGDGLKEFFTAVENLNLEYEDTRIFIGTVAHVKVFAMSNGGDLNVYTSDFKQYKVGYDDADLLDVQGETPSIVQLGGITQYDPTIDYNDLDAMLKGIANQIYQWWRNQRNSTGSSVLFIGFIDEDPYIATLKVDDGWEVFIHCFGLRSGEKYETKDYYVKRINEDDITVTDLTNAGESLVIDMGIYANDSTEEALKELFVSIKNKALPTAINYIYTAKVNDIKVKGMFDDTKLQLDTNLQENYAEVKYEVCYDDEDNLLVRKYWLPTYNESGFMDIQMEDGDYSICLSAEDRLIEITAGDTRWGVTPDSVFGVDSQGNEYNIDWKDLNGGNKLKLVATGTYNAEFSTPSMIEYDLDQNLEINKFYYIERYDDGFGMYSSTIVKTIAYRSVNGDGVATFESKHIKCGDEDTDESVDASLTILHNDYTGKPSIHISHSEHNLYQSEYDTIMVYELPFSF